MKFLLDHCIEASIRHSLIKAGHEVITVADVLPVDSPDVMVATTAQQLEAILISKDRDFNAMKRSASKTVRETILQTNIILLGDCPDIAVRLSEVMDVVQFEWDAAQVKQRRLFICVKLNSFWSER